MPVRRLFFSEKERCGIGTFVPSDPKSQDIPPDEKLMRSLEQKVQVPEHGKDSFHNEIFRKVAMAHRHGEQFDYTTHEKLKEAIEKQLFEERRDTIKLTISARSPDTEQVRKLNDVVETLSRCADGRADTHDA